MSGILGGLIASMVAAAAGGSIGNSVSKNGSGAASQTSSAITINNTSTVVVGVTWGSAAFTSITDSAGNTYTQIGSEVAAGARKSRLYYAQNVTGGSLTFTATVGSTDDISFSVVELRGMKTTGVLDQTGTSLNDASSPYALGTGITTTQADEILVAFLAGDSGSNPATHAETGLTGSNNTIQTQITNGSVAWPTALAAAIKSSTGTYNCSFTESGAGSGHVHMASFKVGP